MSNDFRLVLYSRSYCHLCEDMRLALVAELGARGIDLPVDVVDVDSVPALVERYDELVPVLVLREGAAEREICHYFLDRAALHSHLDAAGI